MIKIYINEKSDADTKIKLKIKDLTITAEISSDNPFGIGSDTIETLLPYNSYALARCEGLVKNYRKMTMSDFKFLDLNRLGTSIKMDFGEIVQLYADRDILQIDTGMIGGSVKDIVIRIFAGSRDNLEIDCDEEYEILFFNSDDLIQDDHPRQHLWDSYALMIEGVEYMANRKGMPISHNFMEPILLPKDKDYLECSIIKYKGDFEGEKLQRDIDDEDVFVESSFGLVNNRRVSLDNGRGDFRIYPFGHEGIVKIKLGRKWYEVWNEYNLRLEKVDETADNLSRK